ncbi:MAG TPA: hypothetical protein VFQ63_01225 [Patescibacteria group bacterium]|nr:hypothetical protein [Patescibacteria group bacterium]
MHRHIDEEISDQRKRGVLLVLTGPTGAGKDTVFHELMAQDPSFVKVVTTVSRDMRANESQGNPYHFISRDEFEKKISQGAFFEWVEFRGHLYGTLQSTLEEALATGHDVIWHIDTKGVKNIKEKVKNMVPRSAFVFLTAPSVDSLKSRVQKDEQHMVHHRWNEPLVVWEIEQYDDCDYLVINEDGNLAATVGKVRSIIEAKRQEIL